MRTIDIVGRAVYFALGFAVCAVVFLYGVM